MEIKTINADMLAKMFLAGAQNIEAKKEYINELNVFPVPDGDTGTNMSMTIMSAAGQSGNEGAVKGDFRRFAARCQRKLRGYSLSASSWIYQVHPG